MKGNGYNLIEKKEYSTSSIEDFLDDEEIEKQNFEKMQLLQ
jgi:hypothetical protein